MPYHSELKSGTECAVLNMTLHLLACVEFTEN